MNPVCLLLFSFVAEAIIIWMYAASLFVPRRSTLSRIGSLAVFYLLLFLIGLLKNANVNIIGYFAVNIIYLRTQYELHLWSSIFHSAILTAFKGFFEMAVFGITPYMDPRYLSSTATSFTLYTIFNKLLFFAAVFLLTNLLSKKTTDREYFGKPAILLLFIPISSIFIMLAFFALTKNVQYSPFSDFMVTISAMLLLFINFTVFAIRHYFQKKNEEFTEMQLLLQKESDAALYYEMLFTQYENQSILIHDIKNHLQSIRLLNQEKENARIEAYINQLMESSDLRESVRICDNKLLNTILCRYQKQCMEQQIDFHADIRSKTLHGFPPNDLTSLFTNLLENAVEAARPIPDSFIEITVQQKENTPFIVIIVVNSCMSNPMTGTGSFPVSHKTQKSRHGFGIKSMNKIVQKYKGEMQMYYDTATSTFHTIITLKEP